MEVNMKKFLLLLSTVSIITASDLEIGIDELNSNVEALSLKAAEPIKIEVSKIDEEYSSDVEYANHQKVHERFFRRTTKNTTARAAVDKFKQELSATSNLSRISLDGLSSRTRIIMMRELIAAANGVRLSIPLEFQGKKFDLDLNPTKHQPGNGELKSIGSYSFEVFPVLISHQELQASVAKKLAEARKVSASHAAGQSAYHPAITDPNLTKGNKSLDLEMLNILLDFEVARRLIGTQEEEGNAYVVKKRQTCSDFSNHEEN